jgi:molybdopterin/thiamine biosynthesis adenylyltransferase
VLVLHANLPAMSAKHRGGRRLPMGARPVNVNSADKSHQPNPGSVTVVGAGNIGSHLLALIARMPAVRRVTIVDHGWYDEERNLVQAIAPADLGQPKAEAQAMRLREINPRLQVRAIGERVENVPLGGLRADAIVGCLDSPWARRAVNAIAFRLGIPYIDAGIQADGMLARIHVYNPGTGAPCLECLWVERDYRAEQARFSCDGTVVEPAATNAPAGLSALGAVLAAIELEKILAGDWAHVAIGHEILIDARSHRHFVTRLPANAACRFDHRTFCVREFPGPLRELALADLFARGMTELRVEGQQFVLRWACGTCQASREAFGLRARIAGTVLCPGCGRGMRAIGFHLMDVLTAEDVPEGQISAPLTALGFCAGDIFTASNNDEEVHFELTDSPVRES